MGWKPIFLFVCCWFCGVYLGWFGVFVGDIYLYVINCNMSGEIGAKYGEKLAVKSDVDDENRSKIGFLFMWTYNLFAGNGVWFRW